MAIPVHHPAGGTIWRHADVASAFLPPRHVDIWFPPGYSEDRTRRYPVLYMHDGQNLFDPTLAFAGVDWGVAEAMIGLMDEGYPGALIVGVWNTPWRGREYMPALRAASAAGVQLHRHVVHEIGGPPESDSYLWFLAHELKPLIDSSYRTRRGPHDTFLMGSSMGGLISLYGLTEYPDVFGGAASLSTPWLVGGDLRVDSMAAILPGAGTHRLYFDYGTEGVDAPYEPFQRRMDTHLQAAGYRAGYDWLTLRFAGADHNEAAWRARVHRPLAHLLSRDHVLPRPPW
ncbi:MAG TPA: alpha/beta hydrolase-fold protein [Roseiflexaceae bacterium]|nr:alpha/beta hydrolase-fold protein [Roseiflexaceae bacterium]